LSKNKNKKTKTKKTPNKQASKPTKKRNLI